MNKSIRYIGSKEKILGFLDEVIFSKYKDNEINFLDGFTGTTVVSKYILDNYSNFNIYLADISDYSEILASRLFFNNISNNIFFYISYIINTLNNNSEDLPKNGIFFNEFSINGQCTTINESLFSNQEIKSRMFFTEDVGLKIDYVRSYIKNLYNNKNINKYEKDLLLLILLTFADKNANTTSIYGAYLKNQNRKTKKIDIDLLELLRKEHIKKNKHAIQYYKSDILTTLDNIPKMDLIYLDPPYTTRRYESNYHILNYICNLDFKIEDIKENSISGLPKILNTNPFGSKKSTRKIFEEMVLKSMLKTKNLYISYSTDGEMKKDEVYHLAKENNFKIEIIEKDYNRYKSNDLQKNNNLQELIYHIYRK